MGSVLDLQPASVCVLCCASRPRSLQRGTALAGMGWGLVGISVPTPRPCLGLPWASQPAYIPELPGASRRVPLPCPAPSLGTVPVPPMPAGAAGDVRRGAAEAGMRDAVPAVAMATPCWEWGIFMAGAARR